MRIQPQHAQLLAFVVAMARHGRDRTDRQAVIPAQHDRQATCLKLLMYSRIDGCIPSHHLVQMTVTVRGRLPWIERPLQVAAVDHLQPTAFQPGRQVGHPQCFRSHRGTAMSGADVGRHTNQ